MWVRSQDKMTIGNFIMFSYDTNYMAGHKDPKTHSIIGSVSGYCACLGEYETELESRIVLTDIENHLDASVSTVYQMPQRGVYS